MAELFADLLAVLHTNDLGAMVECLDDWSRNFEGKGEAHEDDAHGFYFKTRVYLGSQIKAYKLFGRPKAKRRLASLVLDSIADEIKERLTQIDERLERASPSRDAPDESLKEEYLGIHCPFGHTIYTLNDSLIQKIKKRIKAGGLEKSSLYQCLPWNEGLCEIFDL